MEREGGRVEQGYTCIRRRCKVVVPSSSRRGGESLGAAITRVSLKEEEEEEEPQREREREMRGGRDVCDDLNVLLKKGPRGRRGREEERKGSRKVWARACWKEPAFPA